MASLENQSIASSYEQVLHVDTDGGGNGTTLVPVKDGDNGTTFALQMATDKIQVDGDLTVDTDTLYVDSTNNRVGVGTTSPGQLMEIKSAASQNSTLLINTTTAGYDSQVLFQEAGSSVWNIYADGSASNNPLLFYDYAASAVTMQLENGSVIKPKQPAFLVKASSTQSNIAINTDTTVTLDSEIFDQGSDFASNTFTAPVSGRYQLNAHLYIRSLDTASSYFHMKIVTSNRTYNSVITPSFSSDPSYWEMMSSHLADMDAGDTAYIQVYQSGGTQQVDIENQSYFSGYLAC